MLNRKHTSMTYEITCEQRARARHGLFWVTVCVISWAFVACGAGNVSVRLQWDPSPSSHVVGYAVYYGTSSGNYTARVDAGSQTTVSISGLVEATTYYFAAVAYTDYGVESLPSDELAYKVPSLPINPGSTIRILGLALIAEQVALSWVTRPGETYIVVYKDSLADPFWIVASPALVATGTVLHWTEAETAGKRRRFYSVTRLLPSPLE